MVSWDTYCRGGRDRSWDSYEGGRVISLPRGGDAAAFAPAPWTWRDPSTIPPRRWLLGGTLMRGYATLLAAQGGVGKTAVAISCALAVATGNHSIIGQHVFEAGPAWLLTLEDDEGEIERRIAAAMIAHNVAAPAIDGKLFVNDATERPLLLAEPDVDGAVILGADVGRLIAGIRAHRIVLTIIDPLVNAHALVENVNEQMARLAELANLIARETNSALLLATHVRKGGGEDGARDAIRGGSALVDGARLVRTLVPMTQAEAESFHVEPEQAVRFVRLHDAKSNLKPKDRAAWFELVSVPLGNTTIDPARPAGDHVQAACPWKPPALFDGVDLPAMSRIFGRLRTEPEVDWSYSLEPRSRHWAGDVVVEETGLPRKQAQEVLRIWRCNGVIHEVPWLSPTRNRSRRIELNESLIGEMLAPLRGLEMGK